MPDTNPSEALEALSRLENRLAEIEVRVVALERTGQARPRPTLPASPAPRARATSDAGRESGSAGNALGAVGVICFALAGIFLVKLAIEEGWLTPLRQLGLAVTFGLGLVGAGLLLRRRDASYSGYLPAAGVIVLYAAALAAHSYLGLVPWEGAVLLAGLVSTLCLMLQREFRSDLYAVTAAIGAYFVPLLAGTRSPGALLPVYFVLASLTFGAVAAARRSRALPLAAAYFAIACTEFWALGTRSEDHLLLAALQAFQFLIFAGGAAWYSVRNRMALNAAEAWAYFPALIFFYAIEYRHLRLLSPEWAPWLSIGFALLLLGIQRVAGKQLDQGVRASRELAASFGALVLLHSGYLVLLPADYRGIPLVLLVAALVLGAGSRLSDERRREGGPASGLLLVVFGIFALSEYLSLANRALSHSEAWAGIPALLFALGMGVLAMRPGDVGASFPKKPGELLLFAAHLQGILGLYRLVEAQGSLAVSASWAGYAGLILALAARKRDAVWARSSLIVLGLAAGKALLYDVSNATPGVRILCLLLTGGLLYAGGWLFRRLKEWELTPP
ncbi:MAG: DUF2339 domain-containing protein [Oligoflexia bacterium]|nr:DUF2339 domain-containing protein [Oligoflexia bacterium]